MLMMAIQNKVQILLVVAVNAARGKSNTAVLCMVTPRIIQKTNHKFLFLPNATKATIAMPKATPCRVYPIATTTTKYGIETAKANKGRGKLLQNTASPVENISAHITFTPIIPHPRYSASH